LTKLRNNSHCETRFEKGTSKVFGVPFFFFVEDKRMWSSSGVGAMDVSWSEAQRAETNVIARSDDRAVSE
jgi:hypothetical protein